MTPSKAQARMVPADQSSAALARLDEIEERLNHQPCCEHRGSEYGNCFDCMNTGCAHPPYVEGQAEDDLFALVEAVKAVRAARKDLSHHHAHMVPGHWDKDGSLCDVCVRVGVMDAALSKLEAA